MSIKYQNIQRVLSMLFNVDHGLSEDVARSLYIQTVTSSPALRNFRDELQGAFQDKDLSWKDMLLNEKYEVFDAQNEEEAREYAYRILWEPLLESAADLVKK